MHLSISASCSAFWVDSAAQGPGRIARQGETIAAKQWEKGPCRYELFIKYLCEHARGSNQLPLSSRKFPITCTIFPANVGDLSTGWTQNACIISRTQTQNDYMYVLLYNVNMYTIMLLYARIMYMIMYILLRSSLRHYPRPEAAQFDWFWDPNQCAGACPFRLCQ